MPIVDLDDFCEVNSHWDLVLKLKDEIPNLKLNLFTIIGKCSADFIREMQKVDWIDMIPHGLYHQTSRECEKWSYEFSINYLRNIRKFNLTKGFKAPGWQISGELFYALYDENYWVADQPYNKSRRPVDIKVYELDSPDKIHGHLGHLGGHNKNELSLIWDDIVKHKEKEFKFIKEVI